jgi:hypothetical protein
MKTNQAGILPIFSFTKYLILFLQIQSYRFEDVVFQEGARFRPCIENVVSRWNTHKEWIRIDLDRFQEIDTVATTKRNRTPRLWQRSARGHDGIFFQKRT